MLPLPSSSRAKPRFAPAGAYMSANHGPLSGGNVMGALRSRSRLTNLAVALLLFVLCFSLIGNLHHLTRSEPQAHFRWQSAWYDLADNDILDSGRPPSVETTIHRDKRMADVDHLIIVPGHAVWSGQDPKDAHLDSEWVLEPMQKGGSINTFIKHIEQGTQLLAENPRSLLVFSGGATRPHLTTPMSEGASYHRLANALGLISHDASTGATLAAGARATTEEYALDSYENLLFSIARFREVTGRYPAHITVVGYGMKQHRFEQLHRGAIRYPSNRFTYIGIDDEGDTSAHYEGELKNAYAHFLFAPSGCRPPLSTKRATRNPFARYPPYHASTPELVPLLEWCPPETPIGNVAVPTVLKDTHGVDPPAGFVVYKGPVPWDKLIKVDHHRD